MIKKLRRKFIIIAMSSVAAVLFLIIGIVNIVNYVQVDRRSDRVIAILAEGEGQFPSAPPAPDKWHGITRETPFETRFFTATLDEQGDIASIDMRRIAALSESEARSYVEHVRSDGDTHGMYNDFKYTMKTTSAGEMYIFLDCSRDMAIFRNFLLLSICISAGSLILIFILIFVLSKFVLKPVEESYAKQKSFITDASHDIKTPLTVINVETEILEMENGENEYTREIKNQVARLTSLSEKLVLLAKMDEDPHYEMTEVDLSALLEDLLPPYGRSAGLKKFDFRGDIAPGLTVKCNADLVGQAVGLMLDNALNYALPGGKISVELKQNGKYCEFVMRNDAEGFSAGKHDELFDRFYRSDSSRNSQSGGHGIGLSVVKKIAELHKAKLSAHSDDGKSIEFTLSLPI